MGTASTQLLKIPLAATTPGVAEAHTLLTDKIQLLEKVPFNAEEVLAGD